MFDKNKKNSQQMKLIKWKEKFVRLIQRKFKEWDHFQNLKKSLFIQNKLKMIQRLENIK